MSVVTKRYDAAVERIDAHLLSKYAGERLNSDRSAALQRFQHVWRIKTGDEEPKRFFVAVENSFPATLPKVFVEGPEVLWGVVPHVNHDGSVCTDVPQATPDQEDIEGVADHVITKAAKTLRDGMMGANKSDFIDEIESYWSHAADSSTRIWSLIPPLVKSREVHWIRTGSAILIGLDHATCAAWLRNYGPQQPGPTGSGRTWCLKLDTPIEPPAFPKTNYDALELIGAEDERAHDRLLELLDRQARPLPVILQFDTGNGPAQIAISLGPRPRKRRQIPGYRTGKAPAELLLQTHGPQKCIRHNVQRAYPGWIHTRGGARREDGEAALATKHVTIIGCGAIGSEVAQMLANAGVGTLTLVDGDPLLYDNIGRHLLGAGDVGSFKSTAVAKHLRRQFPHLKVQSVAKRWENMNENEMAAMEGSNLIIAATGEWSSDSTLNMFGRSVAKPAVLFSSLEPHGYAGHALLTTIRGGCLACGRDNHGEVSFRVTDWSSGDPLERVPGCGGFFQPYGAAETAPVKGMVASLALAHLLGHAPQSELRSWVGDLAAAQKLGATIMPAWEQVRRAGVIGSMHTQDWKKNVDCAQCQD